MQDWLESLKLAEYYPLFVEAGYDQQCDIQHLTEEDLDKIGMPITKSGHRKRLLSAVTEFAQMKSSKNNKCTLGEDQILKGSKDAGSGAPYKRKKIEVNNQYLYDRVSTCLPSSIHSQKLSGTSQVLYLFTM